MNSEEDAKSESDGSNKKGKKKKAGKALDKKSDEDSEEDGELVINQSTDEVMNNPNVNVEQQQQWAT